MKASEANSQKTAIGVGAIGIIGRAITAALAKDGRDPLLLVRRDEMQVGAFSNAGRYSYPARKNGSTFVSGSPHANFF